MTPDQAREEIYRICDEATEVVYVTFWESSTGVPCITIDANMPIGVMKEICKIVAQIETP